MKREDWRELFALSLKVLLVIWFVVRSFWQFCGYQTQSGWNEDSKEMHGDWPFSRWTTSAKQLRLVNIKLDPNWIADEPAESRSPNRFSEVGDGGRADLWPCVEAEIAPAQYRSVDKTVHNLRQSHIFGRQQMFCRSRNSNLHFGRSTLWLLWKKSNLWEGTVLSHLTEHYMSSALLSI